MGVNIQETVKILIWTWFFIVASMSTVVIFHETYHYFSMDGVPIGICMGVCDIGDGYGNLTTETWVVSYLKWGFVDQEAYDETIENRTQDERNAWIFGFSIWILIMVIFAILEEHGY